MRATIIFSVDSHWGPLERGWHKTGAFLASTASTTPDHDINATVVRLKQRGVTVGTPRTSGTGSIILTITDPDGTRIELSELGPNSLARKAMEAWK